MSLSQMAPPMTIGVACAAVRRVISTNSRTGARVPRPAADGIATDVVASLAQNRGNLARGVNGSPDRTHPAEPGPLMPRMKAPSGVFLAAR